MSRIGKKPVPIPDGVKVNVADRVISVEGKLGKLVWSHRPEIDVAIEGKNVVVSRSSDDRLPRALHGLTRALVRNMVEGVSTGYEKKLEIQGVGYLAAVQKDILQLRVRSAQEDSSRADGDLSGSDPHRDSRNRSPKGRSVRGRGEGRPQAGAVQGQGYPLRRRTGPPQGR
jgi:large subunit ribosomal protein L6